MILRYIIVVFFISAFTGGPYKPSALSPPLEIPLVLSANFGEPRSGHFHSGVDFKTEGVTGKKVFAVSDGFIYRIIVSPTGFGKAIYIRHKNGISTVYGHLHTFSDEVEAYVKNRQYELESFSVNLFPGPTTFKVKEGELIGYSGNTGSSMGPHLHFEVRKSSTEKPVDPIQYYEITDNIKPVIKSIAVYPATENSFVNGKSEKLIIRTSGSGGKYKPNNKNTVSVSGPVGFGINTYDFLNNSWNKCGVKVINLRIDNKLVYSHDIDEFSFAETRYINSHIDYEEKIRNTTYIQKTFLEPNNKLSIYNHVVGDGTVNINDGKLHIIEIGVSDFNNNYSSVIFEVRSDTLQSNISSNSTGIIMPYNEVNEIRHHDINLTFPEDCFYDTLLFRYRKSPTENEQLYSDIHYIHDMYTPVHKNFDISLQVNKDVGKELLPKLCLAYINEENRESVMFAGGEWDNGFVTGSVRNLGMYSVILDTISPTVKPLGITDGATLKQGNRLRFIINDDFSGIASYKGYIDGKWALFEYDPKNSLLSYLPDEERLSKGKKHELLLTLKDNRDNESVLNLEFYY